MCSVSLIEVHRVRRQTLSGVPYYAPGTNQIQLESCVIGALCWSKTPFPFRKTDTIERLKWSSMIFWQTVAFVVCFKNHRPFMIRLFMTGQRDPHENVFSSKLNIATIGLCMTCCMRVNNSFHKVRRTQTFLWTFSRINRRQGNFLEIFHSPVMMILGTVFLGLVPGLWGLVNRCTWMGR